MLKYAALFLLAVLIASSAQAILKWAAMRDYANWWHGYLNIHVLGAYGLLVASFLMSIWAYQGIPLSMGMILETTCYFYAAMFGRMFFGERLTWRKLIGLCLIAGGICVYAVVG